MCHNLNLPSSFHIDYAIWLYPIQPSNSSKDWYRPLLNPFRIIGHGFHSLDHFYWSISLFRSVLLVEPATVNTFLCDGASGFLACWVCLGCFLTTPCCTFGLGCLRPVFYTDIWRMCMYVSLLLLFWHHPFNHHIKQHSIEEYSSVSFILICL